MTAIVIWNVLQILFGIGVVVGIICWMVFTKDGRTFSAWVLTLGTAIGIIWLIPVIIGAAFVALVIYLLMIFI